MRICYFGNIPVEGVEGVQKDEEQPVNASTVISQGFKSHDLPKSEKACFAHPNRLWVGPTLECTENDDWESAGILQSIC